MNLLEIDVQIFLLNIIIFVVCRKMKYVFSNYVTIKQFVLNIKYNNINF